MCMFARGRVLVIKVSENGCKWLREGGRVISRECVRERHLGRECVSMCERPPMESETTRKRLLYTLIINPKARPNQNRASRPEGTVTLRKALRC